MKLNDLKLSEGIITIDEFIFSCENAMFLTKLFNECP